MIFLATNQQELFDRDDYKIISVEESLDMMKNWEVIQLDTETTGKLKILDSIKTFIRL